MRAGLLEGFDAEPVCGPATLLVTDANVAPLLPERLSGLPRHVLEPGEVHKSWAALGQLLEALDAAGLDRDGHVLAVGGGVVTDLAGLAASLHRRGVGWTAVPTTLIGQVDAALGGKTAVNLSGGKNTVGSVHPPRAVLVDPVLLSTLPGPELRAGLAEVLKTAVISGESLLSDVERLTPTAVGNADPLAVDVIRACLLCKDALVREDLHDRGARRMLNLGHTFGHALEAASEARLRHGEAVGLGLLCAARLASVLGAAGGLEQRLRTSLERWNLPVTVAVDEAAVEAQLLRDKKRRAGRNVFVLPLGPGRLELVSDVPAEAVRRALDAVRRTVSTS
ncbi:MAG: 3-dehydroquinate synthase [Planctomycetota bacterium]